MQAGPTATQPGPRSLASLTRRAAHEGGVGMAAACCSVGNSASRKHLVGPGKRGFKRCAVGRMRICGSVSRPLCGLVDLPNLRVNSF